MTTAEYIYIPIIIERHTGDVMVTCSCPKVGIEWQNGEPCYDGVHLVGEEDGKKIWDWCKKGAIEYGDENAYQIVDNGKTLIGATDDDMCFIISCDEKLVERCKNGEAELVADEYDQEYLDPEAAFDEDRDDID